MFSDGMLRQASEEVTKFPLRRVALFGGGRWSRVLLPVIQSLLCEDAELVWITQHGQELARQWLQARALDRVKILTRVDLPSDRFDAAVVATAPLAHGERVRELLECGVPTFCEKPLTLNFADAVALEKLSREKQCALGVNLEMHFASYIEEFALLLQPLTVKHLSIAWLDPWTEDRYGESKQGDVYTSMIDDMWPHCWSLLRRLCPHQPVHSIEGVHYDSTDGQIEFTVRLKEGTARVALSRRFARRVRSIEVNGGEWSLDFGLEPGCTRQGGNSVQNCWSGARPLTRALSSFFEVVVSPELGQVWPLAAAHCLDSIRFAQLLGQEVKQLQEQQFAALRRSQFKLDDPAHRNLIVDWQLPQQAELGYRWPAITVEQQIAFVKHVCDSHGVPYQ